MFNFSKTETITVLYIEEKGIQSGIRYQNEKEKSLELFLHF